MHRISKLWTKLIKVLLYYFWWKTDYAPLWMFLYKVWLQLDVFFFIHVLFHLQKRVNFFARAWIKKTKLHTVNSWIPRPQNKMSFWWKKNPKTSADYVKVLNEQLQKLQFSSISTDNKKKAQEECSKYLDAIKHILLDETTAPLSLTLLYDHCLLYTSPSPRDCS